jgi:hypothetical protein
MGANVPRLDYSGGGCPVLLTEPQSTNLVTYSQSFDNAAWSNNGTIVSNAAISPDGTQNAELFYAPTSTGRRIFYNTTITSGLSYTVSVYAKANNKNFLYFTDIDNQLNAVWFDLSNGTYSTPAEGTANIESVGNNWYRCSLTTTSSTTTGWSYFGISDTSGSVSFTANGTDGVYIWGAQLEQSSYPTSYIKTSGSAVTRNADQVNGAGDAATFNDSEGVLMAEISALANDLTFRNIEINNGTSSNRIILLYANISNTIRAIVFDGGAPSVIIDYSIPILNNNKFLFKYKLNDCSLWVNGFEVGTDTSATMPSGLNNLSFNKFDGGNPFYGKTSQVQYFNTVLTDIELEKLTSWTSFIEMAQAQNYNII